MIEKIGRMVVLSICGILLVALGGGYLGDKMFLTPPTAAFGLLLFLMGGLVVDFYYQVLRRPEIPELGQYKYMTPSANQRSESGMLSLEYLNPPTLQSKNFDD